MDRIDLQQFEPKGLKTRRHRHNREFGFVLFSRRMRFSATPDRALHASTASFHRQIGNGLRRISSACLGTNRTAGGYRVLNLFGMINEASIIRRKKLRPDNNDGAISGGMHETVRQGGTGRHLFGNQMTVK